MSPRLHIAPAAPTTPRAWIGLGSRAIPPPPDYWKSLKGLAPAEQIEELQSLSDARLNEFSVAPDGSSHGIPETLLDRLAADGWLEAKRRTTCPSCRLELAAEEAAGDSCPQCRAVFEEHGGVAGETVYTRDLAPDRDVAWAAAVHGMNTAGAWQEAFGWLIGTTWGRSVPVAVYKYGIVIAGVVLFWRRRRLRNALREKLASLAEEARDRGHTGRPDMIAHSFGTWLIGHLLLDELRLKPGERLRFGRIILTGCILRPDFDWDPILEAGLAQDVLNHFAPDDRVVPWAQLTIPDSGPSGNRGFDGGRVLNIRADGRGHSGLFSMDRRTADGLTILENSYQSVWRPFLTLPRNEFQRLPDRVDPPERWRPPPWPLRGTLFPCAAVPLMAAALLLSVIGIGAGLREAWKVFAAVGGVAAAFLLVLLSAAGLTAVLRRRTKAERKPHPD